MNKTPLRTDVLGRLTALNDQLCFFLLLEHEMVRRFDDFGPGVQSAYTADLFAQNPYAPKIHVLVSQLPDFQRANRAFTFGAYFSTTYEVASDYFDLAEELLATLNGVPTPPRKPEGPEDRYIRVLTAGSLPLPADEVVSTMSYCRYRRNAFIHLGATANRAYSGVANVRGPALNAYWGTTRVPLDFTEARVGPLKEDETITLLKLLRTCIETLDTHLAGVLNRRAVLEQLTRTRFGKESVRMNADVAAQRARTIGIRLKEDFGGSAPRTEIEPIVRKIGIR